MANENNKLSVADVIEALELLLRPNLNSQGRGVEQEKDPFLDVLQQNLTNLKTRLSTDQLRSLAAALEETHTELELNRDVSTTAVEWQFVSTILQLLHLQASLLKPAGSISREPSTDSDSSAAKPKPKRPQDAPPLSASSLSMAQTNTLKNALQFVASLGICPNLIPGVGIPMQHRSKILKLAPIDVATLADITESSESKRVRLSVCVTVFGEFLKVPELQSFITGAHLNDTLAALLQLLHANPEQSKISATQAKETNQEIAKNKQGVHYAQHATSTVADSSVRKEDCESSTLSTPAKDEASKSDRTAQNKAEEKEGAVVRPRTTAPTTADNRHLYRQMLDSLLSSVSRDLLIRELMVLQSGVPRPAQNARNPGLAVSGPPVWLRKACSQLLLRLVRGSEGILHLCTAVTTGSDPSSPSHWKQCGVVAKIIAGCPMPVQQVDHYVSSVSQQLRGLLDTDRKDSGQFTHLVGAVVSSMWDKYREQFDRHFHQPLLGPLHECHEKEIQEAVEGEMVVSEEELTRCLESMFKVYVSGQQPQANVLSVLQSAMDVLWSLFCITRTGVYSIKHSVKELLTRHLKFLGRDKAAECLKRLCVSDMDCKGETADNCSATLTVRFEAGSKGGLQAVYAREERGMNLSETQQVEAVIDVLHDLKKDGVAGELLVTLLKELTEMISTETQQPDIVLPASLQRSEVREKKRGELTRRVTLLHLLASICETFGSECLSDNTQILLFVKASLEQGVAVCQGTTEEEMAFFETETMSMAMGLLTAVMAGALQMEEKHRNLLDEMLPLLEVIGEGHPDEFMQEMASDIRIAIATRGAVWSSLQKNKSEGNKTGVKQTPHSAPKQEAKIQPGKRPASKPLIEVLSDHPTQYTPDKDRIKQPSAVQPKPLIEMLPDETSSAYQVPKVSSQIASDSASGSNSAGVDQEHSCTDGPFVPAEDTVNSSHPGTVHSSHPGTVNSSHPDTVNSSHPDTVNSNHPGTVHSSHPAALSVSSQDTTGSAEMSFLQNSSEKSSSQDRTGLAELSFSYNSSEKSSSQDRTGSAELSFSHNSSEQSSLQTVFEELCDPLLPVRGHALISLAKLVEDGDAETLGKKEVVQKVFEENIRHGDSYLYLAAIRGMSSLSDRFPESVVPSLAAEFAGFSQKSTSGLTAEHRLKVGEAMMKATRNLGETIPKYRELLLAAVLTGARDKDATVRASSVSNLAELCSLLHFSLGSVLQEVFSCCKSLLETDEAIVRRAAALTLAKILEGLDKDALIVLDSLLKDLYRLLKRVHNTDSDDAVRLHANMALVQLDTVSRQFLFPPQTLQKKIQVLSNQDTF
ncbi:transport and Golgi organization protein 6 homolog [Littorina saxatilis]|uniref:Uncharacterized protein n=1 Tax=Littorina saxatilis TaxID=31220 RepID=A0AAN9BYP2_9CAEN